ncbi:superinfection immunity protein [Pseudomonas sp. UBT]|uniref:superinfection immunity protein n=1 Tax=Pseudomonas sp. UBT TaxID=3239198 RepID=UPI003D80A2A7
MITGQGLRMFVLRLLVLGFLAFFSYSMGTQSGPLNAFGTIVAYSSVVFVPMFYMLPTIEAWIRKSTNLPAIAAVNFFLGWSLLGWVAALVWAFKKPSPVVMVREPEVPLTNFSIPTQEKPKKNCQFCGEEILAIAVKCKHCGSDLKQAS